MSDCNQAVRVCFLLFSEFLLIFNFSIWSFFNILYIVDWCGRKVPQLVLLRLVSYLFICSDFLFLFGLSFFSMSLISSENNTHSSLSLNMICSKLFPYSKPMDWNVKFWLLLVIILFFLDVSFCFFCCFLLFLAHTSTSSIPGFQDLFFVSRLKIENHGKKDTLFFFLHLDKHNVAFKNPGPF